MEISVAWLLGFAWIAGILPIFLASFPISSLNSFHQFILVLASRGKILQPSSSSSSSNKFTVPQRFFLHFYLVGVAWTTFLLIITWHYAHNLASLSDYSAYLTGTSKSGVSTAELSHRVWLSVFLLLLMEVQVLRRLYETVFVFNYSPSARMHIFAYLTGLFFYTAAPLSLCHFYFFEALHAAEYRGIEMNVKNEDVSSVDFNWWYYIEPIVKLGWCQLAGAAIFAWGWVHQRRCHAILGSLRKRRERADEYVIPYGDWFEMVSSPHYLAEMIIYLGLLVASGGTDFTIWLLNLFVVANLGFAAAETQRWYLRKFEDYPRTRRAILPFVY
ncbi:polyprenol reductase 2-like [Mercurialis annua]|uniref:polyprenol reductase 2-like n=1 Tax=Mercurialis annua TaxID=3986 RepID=UPI00215FF187|nr:polyprenol reductase 2-like [Mercurialis annua]XP_050228357.1 polyprenol reductase 2-like [Mercurialis annua]XP_050228358.1 polyprenol reductase 2-like [Mercurialis annua]XP_050228359.1 polyprenol reductase 2-like [Mercurialis annua]